MDDNYVCFCLWEPLEQELLYCCEECKERGVSKKDPWANFLRIESPPPPQPHIPEGDVIDPIIHRGSGIHVGGALGAAHLRAEEAAYEGTLVPTSVLHTPLNAQEFALYCMGQLPRSTFIYRKFRLWERIEPDATHGQGCALVCAGLFPIIGAFFHECDVTFIPQYGDYDEGKTQVGKVLASKRSLRRYLWEMAEDRKYEVRVTKFGQSTGPRGLMTSRQFDYFSPEEMPYMAVVVRHLLLYLGAGRDNDSSYRIYQNTAIQGEGNNARKYMSLFGMVRFPSSPAPSTATWARMINLAPNDKVPTPSLQEGPADWLYFCNSPFQDMWPDITMRDFKYETFRVREQGVFRQRALPRSRTLSNATLVPVPLPPPPPPEPQQATRPASAPPAAAETQNEIAADVARLPPPGIAPPTQDQVDVGSLSDLISHGRDGVPSGAAPCDHDGLQSGDSTTPSPSGDTSFGSFMTSRGVRGVPPRGYWGG